MANQKLKRKSGFKPYRRVFVISTEGSITEPDYFSMFGSEYLHIKIVRGKCKRAKKSSPKAVLQRMKDYLEEEGFRDGDQHWLVIDKDKWKNEQIQPLYDWTVGAKNRGFAFSNPSFEYWLLLHFDAAKNVTSSKNVLKRLEKFLPKYNKSLDASMLQKLKNLLPAAIENAKQKDVPLCEDWPRINGTTVYRLIEEILKIKN